MLTCILCTCPSKTSTLPFKDTFSPKRSAFSACYDSKGARNWNHFGVIVQQHGFKPKLRNAIHTCTFPTLSLAACSSPCILVLYSCSWELYFWACWYSSVMLLVCKFHQSHHYLFVVHANWAVAKNEETMHTPDFAILQSALCKYFSPLPSGSIPALLSSRSCELHQLLFPAPKSAGQLISSFIQLPGNIRTSRFLFPMPYLYFLLWQLHILFCCTLIYHPKLLLHLPQHLFLLVFILQPSSLLPSKTIGQSLIV